MRGTIATMNLERWKHRLAVWTGRETARHLRLLKEGEEAERLAAARALRTLPVGPRDVAALIAALDDPSPFVRWEVADTLAALGPKVSLGPCVGRARAAKPPAGTAAAVRALAALGGTAALEAILSLVDHDEVEVRVAVADALAHFAGEPSAQEALRRLIGDEHPVVRRAAAWALRRLDEEWAHEVLAQRAGAEPEPWLRQVLEL